MLLFKLNVDGFSFWNMDRCFDALMKCMKVKNGGNNGEMCSVWFIGMFKRAIK